MERFQYLELFLKLAVLHATTARCTLVILHTPQQSWKGGQGRAGQGGVAA